MVRKAGRRGASERARARREEMEAAAVAAAEGQGFVEEQEPGPVVSDELCETEPAEALSEPVALPQTLMVHRPIRSWAAKDEITDAMVRAGVDAFVDLRGKDVGVED